jgi:hypothetical protein
VTKFVTVFGAMRDQFSKYEKVMKYATMKGVRELGLPEDDQAEALKEVESGQQIESEQDTERNPLDDLLSVSRQACTTSSAYILQKSTAGALLQTTKTGLEKMIGSGDQHNFCIDRYWVRLPKIYFFKTKLAYQRPSYSNLTKLINFNLD